MKKFALAGNPNCGKTTLFNNLTGSTAHVGNWPGVTVDKKEGIYKKCPEPIAIVDLPGIYSLSPYTPEEVISRNYILDEQPDCIINIVDATNLERNLYLTTQIMEIDVPIIIALNMMDSVTKNGEKIDSQKIEDELGVPVVEISALKEDHIDILMQRAYETCLKKRKGLSILVGTAITHLIGDVKIAFEAIQVQNPLFHAIKLVELDEIEVKDHENLVHVVEEFKNTFNDSIFGTDFEAIVADSRYKYISKKFSNVKTNLKGVKDKNNQNEKKSDKIDKVLTNKWLGIPIFLLILFSIFHLTFTEDLFFLGGLFTDVSPSFEGTIFEGLIWTESGINSFGVIFQSFVTNITDFLTGIVGQLLLNSPSWVSGLICDGVLGGLFAVLSFLPQILLLFLFFSILEDTGYMARVAFILDRIFRKFGLSGRAFMPMIMGFGCSVPAMVNTRTLADENERAVTIRVIPFFSCGAKLPILTAIAGAICLMFNFPNVDIITYSMYLIGIITAIVAVILMRKTSMRGDVPPFIMELPTYHLPQVKSLMFHLWDKLKHFIKKAFTIILASTIVIWFLQSFTKNWIYIEQVNAVDVTEEVFTSMIEDNDFCLSIQELNKNYTLSGDKKITFSEVVTDMALLEEIEEKNLEESDLYAKYDVIVNQVFSQALVHFNSITSDRDYVDTSDSILAGIGQVVQPLFTPMGFGSNLDKDHGWVFGVSAVTGLIAKENVIATFSVIAQSSFDGNISSLDNFKNLYFATNDEEGISSSIQMINSAGVGDNWSILIAFIVFNMTTIPCFATIATAKAEFSSNKKRYRNTLIFWLTTSYIISTACFMILTWWWTSFIYASLIALCIVGIHFYNKRKDMKSARQI